MNQGQLFLRRDTNYGGPGDRIHTSPRPAISVERFVGAMVLRACRFPLELLIFVVLAGWVLAVPLAAQPADSGTQLYFFTSQGCAPCKQVEPEIESLQRAGYSVITVDLAKSPDWGKTFSVNRTPTVIMVVNQRIVGRHAGLIDAATLKGWFASVGYRPGQTSESLETKVSAAFDSGASGKGAVARGGDGEVLTTYAELPDLTAKGRNAKLDSDRFAAPRTMHAGTPKPANPIEAKALNATVRLRVRDAEGISYATGTVIHSHAGEWLVMTCGHTFREAGFKGKITAEFNFLSGPVQSADGELISFDAESKDVALVAVHAGHDIQPVKLAEPLYAVDRGLSVFSIGCDGGAEPTIRHTQIKNKAIYAPGAADQATGRKNSSPGAVKYDIYGRPAIGRSGGGLFNQAGELIGVCNAAAVDSDEGIYSALDSLHWQIASAKLDHLFVESAAVEPVLGNSDGTSDRSNDNRFASLELPRSLMQKDQIGENQSLVGPARQLDQLRLNGMQPVVNQSAGNPERSRVAELREAVLGDKSEALADSDTEVIIIVRSKSVPQLGESITINNPTPQLIQYLGEMKRGAERRRVDIARVRNQTE